MEEGSEDQDRFDPAFSLFMAPTLGDQLIRGGVAIPASMWVLLVKGFFGVQMVVDSTSRYWK